MKADRLQIRDMRKKLMKQGGKYSSSSSEVETQIRLNIVLTRKNMLKKMKNLKRILVFLMGVAKLRFS